MPKKKGKLPFAEPIILKIPANLDLESLLKTEGRIPTPKEVESLAYVCFSVVSAIASRRNEQENEEKPFFPVCASILQQVVEDYLRYLDILKQKGIMQTDGQFIPGEKCRGYRFTEPLGAFGLRDVQITNKFLKRRIVKSRHKKLKEMSSTSGFRFIAKWWNNDLFFDQNSALRMLKQKQESLSAKLNFLTGTAYELAQKELTVLAYHEVAILNFCYPYRITRDKNSNRIHTNLTNLKKEFRNHLTYKGKSLISIDLKNSQPFLLLNLLKPEFWQKKANKTGVNIFKISKGLKSLTNTYFTLPDSLLLNDIQTLKKSSFSLDVCSGDLYEKIIEQLLKEGYALTRNQVKIEIYKVLFGSEKIRHLKAFKVLTTLYPNVAAFILELKKRYPKNTLALILQRLESFMVIDLVCKRISIENPEVPLFTIHDSIVTTAENQEYVSQRFSEMILQYTGFTPTLALSTFEKPQEEEIKWVPIPGFESLYEISEHGLIKSIGLKRRKVILKSRIDRAGYYTVRLTRNGKTETHFLHRLIAKAYIPNPENKPWVNHLNGDKKDNSITNLEWSTASENTKHAYANHLVKKKGRPVVNFRTGVKFPNIKQASLYSGIKYSTLRNYLNGSNPKNPTGFIYQNSTLRLPLYHLCRDYVFGSNGIYLLGYQGTGVPKYFGDHI